VNFISIVAGISATLFAATALHADVRVVDGDTLEIDGTTYRVNGIDAPEYGQKCKAQSRGTWPCGKEAVAALISLVDGKGVRCDSITEDGFGRTVATCYADDKDIGALMVEQGWAWAFVKYSDVYVAEEQVARDAGLGIWQADTMPAWEYRAQRWQVAEQTSPAGCPIKGNISSNGKIYHAPWSPWYSRTKISEEKGERWFCSEDQAVAAGWRAPRWN
jgi:endonuclease YncB( thermonuclease family)